MASKAQVWEKNVLIWPFSHPRPNRIGINFNCKKSIDLNGTMNHDALERLLAFWKGSLFFEPFLLSTFIVCFIIGIRYHLGEQERICFVLYFLVGILLLTVPTFVLVFQIYRGREFVIFGQTADTVFVLAEFTAFYFFFKKTIQKKVLQRIFGLYAICLFAATTAFFISMIFCQYSSSEILRYATFINVIEFIFLCTMCLAYFHQLFSTRPEGSILHRPSLFIVISSFLYSIVLIPFFMLIDDFPAGAGLYGAFFACHYVLLILVLVSVARAFLSKTPITN